MKNFKNIYSDTIGKFIPRGFIRKYSIGDEVKIGQEHFTWNESDALYWSDDRDDMAFDYEDVIEPYISCTGSRVDFIFD